MLGLALAVVVGAVSAAGARRVLLRVAAAAPEELRAAVTALRGGDPAAGADALGRALPGADSALLHAIREGRRSAAAVAALNEELGDVARLLERDRAVPPAAARASLFGGALGAVAELLGGLGQPSTWAAAAAAFVAGGVAAAVSAAYGRRARSEADRLRQAWDALAAAVDRRLGASDRG